MNQSIDDPIFQVTSLDDTHCPEEVNTSTCIDKSVDDLTFQVELLDVTQFPKEGITLKCMNEFVSDCGGHSALINMTTTDVCERYLKPRTNAYKSSYCQYLKLTNNHVGRCGTATVFISHAWKFLFLEVVKTLEYHFRNEADDIIIWFDLFSNNQHGAPQLDFNWWCTTFKSAIAELGRTVMILTPWADPIPLTRSWCLYELYCTAVTGAVFEVAMTSTEQEKFLLSVVEDEEVVLEMIGQVNIERSEAWSEADRDRIFEVVSQTIGCDRLNRLVFTKLQQWVSDCVLDAMAQTDDEARKNMLRRAYGVLLRNYGKYEEARPVLELALSESRRLLDSDKSRQEETMLVLYHLGWLLDDIGEQKAALPMYEECLERRRQVLGEHHEKVLDTMNTMALLNFSMGNRRRAKKILESCLLSARTHLGLLHRTTLSVLNNSATLLCALGEDNEQAEQLLKESLELHTAFFQGRHPKTITCASNLGYFYSEQGRYEESLELYSSVLQDRRTKLGNDHPDTISSMNNLASLLSSMNRRAEARLLLGECVERGSSSMGAAHPDVLMYKNNLRCL